DYHRQGNRGRVPNHLSLLPKRKMVPALPARCNRHRLLSNPDIRRTQRTLSPQLEDLGRECQFPLISISLTRRTMPPLHVGTAGTQLRNGYSSAPIPPG